jgi:hypothetical protein
VAFDATKPEPTRGRCGWMAESQVFLPGVRRGGCPYKSRQSGPARRSAGGDWRSQEIFSCQRASRLSPGERTRTFSSLPSWQIAGRASTDRSVNGSTAGCGTCFCDSDRSGRGLSSRSDDEFLSETGGIRFPAARRARRVKIRRAIFPRLPSGSPPARKP